MTAASLAALVGRWVMFNFGFGDVIDRFEKHFGAKITKVLFGIVGIALAIFLVAFTFKEAIYPLVLWIGSAVSGDPTTATAREGVSWIAMSIWLVSMLIVIVSSVQSSRILNRVLGEQERWIEAHEQAKKILADMDEYPPQFEMALAVAIEDLERATEENHAATKKRGRTPKNITPASDPSEPKA
jgi:heme exporter protein D